MNDYSQIPVLDDTRTCRGAVTWKSVVHAQLKEASPSLKAAIVDVHVRSYSHDLHSLLPLLQAEDFIVVTNSEADITGIVTTSDIVGLYGERTQPFLLIGELDQELRHLMTTLDLGLIKDACSAAGAQKFKSYDDMTMFHYVTVLRSEICWNALDWPLDRVAFVDQLDSLRRVRNDVMHFNPDGVPEGTVEKLRHMLMLIREFGPAKSI